MRTWTPSSVRVDELKQQYKILDVDLNESELILAVQRQICVAAPSWSGLNKSLAHHLENDWAWEKAKAFWLEEQSYRQSGYTLGSTTPPLGTGEKTDKTTKEAPAHAQAQAVRLTDPHTVRCYGCGHLGHIAKFCPHVRSAGSGAVSRGVIAGHGGGQAVNTNGRGILQPPPAQRPRPRRGTANVLRWGLETQSCGCKTREQVITTALTPTISNG